MIAARHRSVQAARRFFAAAILVFGLAGCSTVPSLPTSAGAAERQSFLDAWIDRTLDRQQDSRAPGVALVVVKDGKTLIARGKGMADDVHPIDENTVFDLASVSKPITAIAVMQLVESGRLALDDSILKWMPELPSGWSRVTLHHLLSHQSGIPDPTHVKLAEFQTLDGIGIQDLIRRWHDVPLKFAPGSDAEYSNANYMLLAEIIARSSGQGYAAYLKQHVFIPAGMYSTSVGREAPDTAQTLALAYARTDRIYGIDLALQGASGIRSSVSDLRRLIDALLAGRLISRESLGIMTRPQSIRPVLQQEEYGYGFFVKPDSAPLTMFAHTGDFDGYRSYMRINLSKGVYYVILGNAGEQGWPVITNLAATIQMAYERD